MATNTIHSINQTISEIHFKITRKLGEGMFSTVKLATHSLTGEQVAIKILEKTRISKKEDKERINREIAIMKKLYHYNIAKLYQIVENKYTIYLIQEHVQGKEFLDYLTKNGKLNEIEACKFFHQIISGLEYIHQCGIAHRDFKPENILLTNNNTILKIIDFGLGNFYKNNQLLKTSCGSPCYAPPEMIKEENYNGALSDIWSSGIILYLMLCGNLPFYHEKNDIMFQKILSGKFDLPKYLSNNAKDILKKILEVDPKKRIKFEEIKSHPWFNIIDKNYLIHKGINVNEDIIPVDEEIIQNMEKIGFNKMEVRFNIIKNFHNKITTVYDLFLKKKVENGKKSVGDLKSDLFDEYINDKNNKISFYGSLDNALKNRICDGNKKINILPNYYEDKYDDNNENIIVGDNGSVIERLIKAGRFTYDEENMCLNRVTNNNKPVKTENKKKKNDDGDSKFKTLSQMKTTKPKKMQKNTTIEKKEEKNYNANNNTNNNIDNKLKLKKTTKEASPLPKKLNESKNLQNNKKPEKNIKNKKNGKNVKIKENKKEEDDDDNDKDWFKEVEEMIIKEVKTSKPKKSSSVSKRNKKNGEIKNLTMFEDNVNMDLVINKNKNDKKIKIKKLKISNNDNYKTNKKNSNADKHINNNNNMKLSTNREIKNGKNLKLFSQPNFEDISDDYSLQTNRTTNSKIVKKVAKNKIKINNTNIKKKKIDVEYDTSEDEKKTVNKKKRVKSCAKRNNKK